MLKRLLLIGSFFGSFLFPVLLNALTFTLPSSGNDIIGQIQYVHSEKGENIYDVARKYDIGFYEMIEANPGINRHSPIAPEETITIPTEYILPNVQRTGIVINLPELRLYYYPTGQNIVVTEPIAIGRYDWLTPTLETAIIEKIKNPYWHVPKTIKAAAAKKGIYWPDVVPPGPKNPLGSYALRLGKREYLIHGTNNPTSIGKRASSGCMRMYPESIEALFNLVPIGTTVKIVNEFYKVGWNNGVLYLEIHEPLQELAQSKIEQTSLITNTIDQVTAGSNAHIDWSVVNKEIERPSGIPIPISSQVSGSTQSYIEAAQPSNSTTPEEEPVHEQEGYSY
ncbi:MAG: hypothetical protein A3E87_03240 [Gammaproteobacteria bacterium RIFCSPHIGHO2_12_FULL_35_23]|nr:MAG: hypothetical protein A3E87_03240 [Gammaproteobacteria bacterium RIFCSPHIGHO2_12_FULL_35_23]